jgi:hypothetical protein
MPVLVFGAILFYSLLFCGIAAIDVSSDAGSIVLRVVKRTLEMGLQWPTSHGIDSGDKRQG